MFLQGMIGLRVSHVLEVVPPDRLWYLENWKDRVDSLVPYHHRHMFIWSLEVSWNRGIPSHHPFLFGIFHEINDPFGGYQESPSCRITRPLRIWWSSLPRRDGLWFTSSKMALKCLGFKFGDGLWNEWTMSVIRVLNSFFCCYPTYLT
jgi:hypothetical protein